MFNHPQMNHLFVSSLPCPVSHNRISNITIVNRVSLPYVVHITHFPSTAQSGLFWSPDDGISASSREPYPFYMELREPTRMCIKDAQGAYLCAQKNGSFRLDTTDVERATYWEF